MASATASLIPATSLTPSTQAGSPAAPEMGRLYPGDARSGRWHLSVPPIRPDRRRAAPAAADPVQAGNLSHEYDQQRAVVRDLCDKHIAPHAADVDERVRYPE